MNKKYVLVLGALIAIVLIFGILQIQNETVKEIASFSTYEPDVIMPTKSSRPGCDEKDACYIPSLVVIKVGESVTWQNKDAAFHSVTSGVYGSPNELFDSGHLDPNQTYTLNFEKQGTFDYYCSLHPWMKGRVIVE